MSKSSVTFPVQTKHLNPEIQEIIKHINEIVFLTMPALFRTGDIESFKTDAQNRLKLLFGTLADPKCDEEKLRDTVTLLAKVFEVKIEMLALPIFQLFKAARKKDGFKSLLEATYHLSALFDAAITTHKNFKPPVLVERQEAAQKKIDEACKNAGRKIKGNVAEGRSSTDIIFGFDDVEFHLPRGWRFYMKQAWKPPQVFVDAIMKGGQVYISVNRWMGSGTYKSEEPVSFELFERIKKMSAQNELFYALNGVKRRNYHIGYLFGIKTPDGKEYDVDGHYHRNACKKELRFIEATFAEYGDIFWHGKNVTQGFWQRLERIDNSCYDSAARIRNYNDKGVVINLPVYQDNENLNSIYPRDCSLPSGKPFQFDGLVSADAKIESYLSEKYINDIADIISSKSASNYDRPPTDARMVIEHQSQNTWDTSYGFAVSSDCKKMYVTNDNVFPADKFHLEKRFGKQGTVVDHSLHLCHSRYDFTSIKDLETAIDILTNPKCEIVHPADILVRELTIYLMGPVNVANLQLVKANAKSKPAVHDEKYDSMPDLLNLDMKMDSNNGINLKTLIVPKKEVDSALIPVAKKLESFIPLSLIASNQFKVVKTEKTYQFQISLPAKTKAEKVSGDVKADLLKTAFATIAEAAKLKENVKIDAAQDSDGSTLIVAVVNNQDVEKFSAALTVQKGNSRFFEFAKSAFDAIEKVGDEKSSDPYISTAPHLMPAESIMAYQNDLLKKTLISHLNDAVTKNDDDRVKKLIELKADPIEAMSNAASNGNVVMLTVMLDAKVDPNGGNYIYNATDKRFGEFTNNHLNAIKLLISRGATGNKTSHDHTPLSQAACSGIGEAVKYLLLTVGPTEVPYSSIDKPNPNKKKKDIDDAIGFICRSKSNGYTENQTIELAKLLIDAGADLSFRGYDDYLKSAVDAGWYNLAAYFIDRGVSIDKEGSYGGASLTPDKKRMVLDHLQKLKAPKPPMSLISQPAGSQTPVASADSKNTHPPMPGIKK